MNFMGGGVNFVVCLFVFCFCFLPQIRSTLCLLKWTMDLHWAFHLRSKQLVVSIQKSVPKKCCSANMNTDIPISDNNILYVEFFVVFLFVLCCFFHT